MTAIAESQRTNGSPSFVFEVDPPPLWIDDDDVVRVAGTQVLLDVVVCAYEQGETPEEIVDSFDTLSLSDVYAVISYYLHHQEAVRAYLKQREIAGVQLRAEIEAFQSSPEFQARLTAQRTQQGT